MRGSSLRLVCVNDVYSLEALPRLATLVRRAADVDPADRLLVTLAGDFIAPSLLGSLDSGRGMVDCLNHVGVTHVTLGNHEDDVPLDELRKRIGELRAVVLATNVHDLDPRLRQCDLVQVGPIKVGLIGVVMEDRSTYRHEPFGGGVEPAVERALREIAHLTRDCGCDAVIPLTHQQLDQDRALARRAARVPVIAGGHEHTVALVRVGESWIV
jgi:2',3'-cyclic-nucleotide 2'-phosphodiesterase (5'-nucleotidase family)